MAAKNLTPKQPKKNVGRPLLYTEKLADKICQRIANGESLKSICNSKDIPSRNTVNIWRRENNVFYDKYVRAREEQADHFADEIIEIADTEDDPQKARVRIDARKWKAGKMKGEYSDKIVTEHKGGITINKIERVIVDSPND